jgi:hypothetical protein
MQLSQQRMNFIIQNLNKIPGLAAAFRQYMMRGAGGEQANLIGASNRFQSGLRRNLAGTGLGYSGVGALASSMGSSILGQSMADWHQRYNLGSFNLANQDVMQGLQMSMTDDDMRNRIIGGVIGTGGGLLDRALFPRQRQYG